MITSGYTEPEFRGNRLQALTLRYLMEHVVSSDPEARVYGEIHTDNIASIKGNARAGLCPVLRIQGIKFAGLVWFRRIVK